MTGYLDPSRGSLNRYVQIPLYPDQHNHLKSRAAEDGVSVAQIIRDLIDDAIAAEIETPQPPEPPEPFIPSDGWPNRVFVDRADRMDEGIEGRTIDVGLVAVLMDDKLMRAHLAKHPMHRMLRKDAHWTCQDCDA